MKHQAKNKFLNSESLQKEIEAAKSRLANMNPGFMEAMNLILTLAVE